MKKALMIMASAGILIGSISGQDTPADFYSGYVEVDGGELFYETGGNGENIVLLHDGMVSQEIWDYQFPLLAKYYRVTRYDRRGYGKSSDPQSPYSDIEDLNELFIKLGIEKATIFGMSSGGGCAIDFTLKYPEKVNALVLVGAVVGGYGYTSHMTYRGGHLKNPSLMSDPAKAAEYFVWDDPYEIYAENRDAKEKVASIVEANLHRPFDRRYYTPPERIAARFLSEIKVPCLVMVGEHDIPDVHAHAGVISFGIPGSRREVILNSGHLIPVEQPEEFNKSTFRFLRRNDFFGILNTKGVDSAAQYFSTFFTREPQVPMFSEAEMNQTGYQYLQAGKTREAIELFRLNTIAYPDSWNVYDSLGEALLKDGQTDIAIKNYERSLAINPDNENAKTILNGLKQGK
jgi:3-oxoadipate enol-lactonase